MSQPLAAGRAQFSPTFTPPTNPRSGKAVPVVQLVSENMSPKVLNLGTANRETNANSFPEPEATLLPGVSGAVGAGTLFTCGFTDINAGTPAMPSGSGSRWTAAVLEYGFGGTMQTCVFDWRPGMYQLPACTYARVSVLPWGNDWTFYDGGAIEAINAIAFAASIMAGETPEARVPTVTSLIGLNAAVSRSFYTPRKAAAVNVSLLGGTATDLTLTFDDGPRIVRSNLTGVFAPPWGPVQFGASLYWEIVSTLASTAWVQFYLAL